jgi:hypothetical protein
MAKKSGGPNKSLSIRSYKANHPSAGPKEIAAALAGDGVKVSPGFVSTVLSNARRKSGKKVRGRRPGRRAGGGKPDAIAHLIQAKKLAEQMGGIDAARKALDSLARLMG